MKKIDEKKFEEACKKMVSSLKHQVVCVKEVNENMVKTARVLNKLAEDMPAYDL